MLGFVVDSCVYRFNFGMGYEVQTIGQRKKDFKSLAAGTVES